MQAGSVRHQPGFSLLEVLVAVVLLATALLSLGTLSTQLLIGSGTLRDLSVAEAMIEDLEGRLTAIGGVTRWQPGDPAFEAEREAWLRLAESRLEGLSYALCRDATPGDGHRGAYACDGQGPLTVKLFWKGHLPGTDHRAARPLSP